MPPYDVSQSLENAPMARNKHMKKPKIRRNRSWIVPL